MIPQYHHNGQYWFVCELKSAISTAKLMEIAEHLGDRVGHRVLYTYERTATQGPVMDILFSDEDDALMFKILYSEL
jgi:hypothetical protein